MDLASGPSKHRSGSLSQSFSKKQPVKLRTSNELPPIESNARYHSPLSRIMSGDQAASGSNAAAGSGSGGGVGKPLLANGEMGLEDSALEHDGEGYLHPPPMEDGAGLDDLQDTIFARLGMDQRKALWWRNALVTGMYILAWYGFATLLSLYNKWMFSPEYYGFSFPLFVTFCHMLVQFCLAFTIRNLFPRFKPTERPTRQDYVAKIFPAAASTSGDIGLSNLSLKTITLSLYTMCKSSTLIFVLTFAFIFHLEKFSVRLIGVISLISFGVFLMVFDTTSVSVPGIIMVFSASTFSGLRWALTETIMHKKAMGLSNPFATIFWLAPLMALTLAFLSVLVEDWANIFGMGHFDGLYMSIKTIAVIVLPGAIAFAMVASEYFIIQRAGMVPLSVAGIFKEVSTISFSAWLFGDTLSSPNIIGVAIAVAGITLFTYHKYQKSTSAMSEPEIKQVNDTSPLIGSNRVLYAAPIDQEEVVTPPGSPESRTAAIGGALPMSPIGPSHLAVTTPKTRLHYPSANTPEANADRVERLRDDFEGWNRPGWSDNEDAGGEEEEEDADDDEVQKRRLERERPGGDGKESRGLGSGGGSNFLTRSWGPWWQQKL